MVLGGFMRISSLFAALLFAPATAFAWENTEADVEFEGEIEMYRGQATSVYLPSADSAVSLQLSADTDAVLYLQMIANSLVSTEDGDGVVHSWEGRDGGGVETLETQTELSASIRVNAWGYLFSAPVWSEEYEFEGESTFDGLGLGFGSVQSSGEDLVELEDEWEVMDGVFVSLDGVIIPRSTAIVTGEKIITNEVEYEHEYDDFALALPDENEGELPMEATWTGGVVGTFGLDLGVTVGVRLDSGLGLEIPFTYNWAIANSDDKIVAAANPFAQPLPAIDVQSGTVNFGQVDVGDAKTMEVEVEDLGEITLVGDVEVEGDGFDVEDDEITATMDEEGVITITFSPDAEGTFEGDLIITTNDPVNPTVTVPLQGTGAPLPGTDPVDTGDTGEDENQGGLSEGEGDLKGGCGCNSLPANPAGLAGLAAGVVGILARRRRS